MYRVTVPVAVNAIGGPFPAANLQRAGTPYFLYALLNHRVPTHSVALRHCEEDPISHNPPKENSHG